MSTTRSNNWSVTINNPTAKDEEEINSARQRGWKVEGQLERGENGTPHYQLIVKTPQVRFSAVKKAFSRAHIEIARNPKALENYCKKEETREGQLSDQQEHYPSLKKYWQLVLKEMLYGFDKDGLDYFAIMDGKIKMYRREDEEEATDEQLKDLHKRAVGSLIRQGYFVEVYFCNPQNRSAFKEFAKSLLLRAHQQMYDEDNDRQTDTNENGFTHNVMVIDIPNANLSSSPDGTSSSSQDDAPSVPDQSFRTEPRA